jgi:predicted PurR-regulated permease PerM
MLGIFSLLASTAIDSVLRPMLTRGRTRLPALLVFLTLFGGLSVFGIKGALLGPLIGSLALTGLRLMARERAGDKEKERYPIGTPRAA